MTRTTNARTAGFIFLFYSPTGIASMVLFRQATSGAEGTAAKLASIAQHAPLLRLDAVLTLLTFFIAVVSLVLVGTVACVAIGNRPDWERIKGFQQEWTT